MLGMRKFKLGDLVKYNSNNNGNTIFMITDVFRSSRSYGLDNNEIVKEHEIKIYCKKNSLYYPIQLELYHQIKNAIKIKKIKEEIQEQKEKEQVREVKNLIILEKEKKEEKEKPTFKLGDSTLSIYDGDTLLFKIDLLDSQLDYLISGDIKKTIENIHSTCLDEVKKDKKFDETHFINGSTMTVTNEEKDRPVKIVKEGFPINEGLQACFRLSDRMGEASKLAREREDKKQEEHFHPSADSYKICSGFLDTVAEKYDKIRRDEYFLMNECMSPNWNVNMSPLELTFKPGDLIYEGQKNKKGETKMSIMPKNRLTGRDKNGIVYLVNVKDNEEINGDKDALLEIYRSWKLLADIEDLAETWGISAETMFNLAKSQISTCASNSELINANYENREHLKSIRYELDNIIDIMKEDWHE